MAEFVITLSDGRTHKQVLTQALQVMGRDPACDIVLDDPSASRRHAQMRFDNGKYFVEDLGSKNGTLVNEERIESRELHHLDEIVVGSVEILFVDELDKDRPSTVVLADDRTTTSAESYSAAGSTLLLSERRLQMLYELSERLTMLRDRNALLNDALDICFETLRFERGAIAVRRPGSRSVDWPVVRNLRGTGGELTISRSILGRALDYGERAIITDGAPEPVDPTVSMVQHGIRSAMCVPLMREDEIIGVIYGDRVSTGTVYTKEDVDFLAGLARQVSIGLINARLLDEQKSRLELEAELVVARGIQERLFPATLPDHDRLSVAALNEPGRMVSGDYYDVLELSNGRVGFLIADVSGKGMAASLLMSNLQAAVRMTLPDSDDLGALMTRWNALLYANTDESKFVTCLSGVIDPAARTLTFSTAGHHMPFVIRQDGESPQELWMDPEFPLGVVQDVTFKSKTVDLGTEPCVIFCYTDGVIEAMNGSEEQFGEDRMISVLGECAEVGPQALIRRMRKAVTSFCREAPQSDDITMIAIRLA